MYLFSRSARLAAGHTREAAAWAVGVTERVNQITELNVSLWTPAFSPGVGRLIWSAHVEDLAELENAEAKLMVDDGYVAEVDRGAAFASTEGVDDELAQYVHLAFDKDLQPEYASIVRSALAPGSIEAGMGIGLEIAERATKISGVPTSFALCTTGTYGGVLWLSAYRSINDLQRAEQSVNGDPSFVQFIDKVASGVYRAEATTQSVVRRLL
jgi:hypothetical protein